MPVSTISLQSFQPIPFLFSHFTCHHLIFVIALGFLRIPADTVFVVSVSTPEPLSVQASSPICFHPTPCRHPFHFFLVIVQEAVVSGLLVWSDAGNFLLIVSLHHSLHTGHSSWQYQGVKTDAKAFVIQGRCGGQLTPFIHVAVTFR